MTHRPISGAIAKRGPPAHGCGLPRGGRNGGDVGEPGGTPGLGGATAAGAG